jgi:hypothetical protein
MYTDREALKLQQSYIKMGQTLFFPVGNTLLDLITTWHYGQHEDA